MNPLSLLVWWSTVNVPAVVVILAGLVAVVTAAAIVEGHRHD